MPFPHNIPCANVRDYGAVGDGSTDDTAAIQAAIDDLLAGAASPNYDGVGLVFPSGDYLIRDTLVFEGLTGLHVIGAGASNSTGHLNDAGWVGTSIILKNDDSTVPVPMMRFSGCANISVTGLFLVGNSLYASDNSTYATVGILVEFAGDKGSDFLFTDVSVTRCGDGVVAGGTGVGVELLSSDMTFIRYAARFCTRGFVVSHQQALNYSFVSPSFQECDDAIVLLKGTQGTPTAGGSIQASQLSTYNVKRLIVQERSGSNIGPIAINQARLDSSSGWGASYRTTLFERASNEDQEWPTRVTFNSVTSVYSGAASTPRLVVGPRDHITLNNCSNLDTAGNGLNITVHGSGSTSAWAIVDLIGTCVEAPEEDEVLGSIDANAKHRVRLRQCITYPEVPIADADYGTQLGSYLTRFSASSSDQTGIGTTYTSVTGTGLAVEANTNYAFEFVLLCDASSAATGVNVACTGPSSPTSIRYEQISWTGTQTQAQAAATTYNANGTANTSGTTDIRPFRVRGVLHNGANAGTLIATVNAETGGTANVRAGSYGTLTRIS